MYVVSHLRQNIKAQFVNYNLPLYVIRKKSDFFQSLDAPKLKKKFDVTKEIPRVAIVDRYSGNFVGHN